MENPFGNSFSSEKPNVNEQISTESFEVDGSAKERQEQELRERVFSDYKEREKAHMEHPMLLALLEKNQK